MVDTDASSASKYTTTSKSQVEQSIGNASTPYSLFASENPGALITSVMFTGENYNEWSTELVNDLRAKRKLVFIDGSVHKPATVRAMFICQLYDRWLDSFFHRSLRSFYSHLHIRFSRVVGEFKETFLSGKQS